MGPGVHACWAMWLGTGPGGELGPPARASAGHSSPTSVTYSFATGSELCHVTPRLPAFLHLPHHSPHPPTPGGRGTGITQTHPSEWGLLRPRVSHPRAEAGRRPDSVAPVSGARCSLGGGVKV